jgi:hypothetical protein
MQSLGCPLAALDRIKVMPGSESVLRLMGFLVAEPVPASDVGRLDELLRGRRGVVVLVARANELHLLLPDGKHYSKRTRKQLRVAFGNENNPEERLGLLAASNASTVWTARSTNSQQWSSAVAGNAWVTELLQSELK